MSRLINLFKGDLSAPSRYALLLATVMLIPCIFLPTWTISLQAPQYPDGLSLVIYPNTVGGDLSEVNLLNHYIGMHEIEPGEFPEFRFVPFFILRFFGLAVLATLVGNMAIAALGWLDFTVFGAVMLYTLRHWLAEYGNNLSPDAPLNIEPFTPAFIGASEVGQFGVTSMPAIGAILMTIAGGLGPAVVLYELYRAKKGEDS